MITLTEKENKLVQHLIDTNDGSDSHICNKDFIDIKTLNFDIKTLKGVFGSLVQKGLLEYNDTNDNGEVYKWAIPIDGEQQERGCTMIINNKPFKPFAESSNNWFYGSEINITESQTYLDFLNIYNSKLEQHKGIA